MRNKSGRLIRIVSFFIVFGLIIGHKTGNLSAGYQTDYLEQDELLENKMDALISLDLKGVSLVEVLKIFSLQTGLNFIASEAVADRKITLYLDNMTVKDAMDEIFTANNLTYEFKPGKNIFIVKDWGSPALETDTRVYPLKYVSVSNARTGALLGGIKDALTAMLSPKGKIIEDPLTNSLIITDMPSKFAALEKVIKKLDVLVPQVMIEAEIMDVDKSDVDKLGFKFSGTDWLKYTGPNFGSVFPLTGATLKDGLTGHYTGGTSQAKWDMSGLTFAFDFLQSRSNTKFLARPTIFVMNNETAELKLSADEVVGSVTVTQGQGTASSSTTSAERAETGVSLKVTPQVSLATGEITLVIEPSVKEAVTGLTVGSQTTKDIEERSMKSVIRIKDGSTVLLGGLIRNKSTVEKTRVPFFGSIPVVGMLFRHKADGPRKDREIVVFITPWIVRNSADIAQGKRKFIKKVIRELNPEDAFDNSEKDEIVSQALERYDRSK